MNPRAVTKGRHLTQHAFVAALWVIAGSPPSAAQSSKIPATLAIAACGSCHTLETTVQRTRTKALVESVCTLCHEFARVERKELTKSEWAGEIKGMLAEGAPLTEDEFDRVVEYLAITYGVKNIPR